MSSHSVLRTDVEGGWLKRNTPEHIPAILLGMLGVDVHFQGQGLGASLLRDAILRSVEVSDQIGARALLVDSANSEASTFYRHFGFKELGGVSMVLSSLGLATSRHADAGPGDGAAEKSGVPRRQPSRYGVPSRMIA